MDIRRREAELFLLRYDGEETEAIKHLRYVSEQLDEAQDEIEGWEIADGIMSEALDDVRFLYERAKERLAAAEALLTGDAIAQFKAFKESQK